MTRPILKPVLDNAGKLIRYAFLGYDYRADHAYRGSTPRLRMRSAGTSPRRRFRTVALRA